MPFPKADKIWMDGELVDWDDATVHVLTPSLHYGWAVFEGIRAYETERGPAVFRLREHVERLFDSAKIYHPLDEIPYTPDEIVDVIVSLIRENGHEGGCYIRPIVYLGYGEIGLNPLPSEPRISIATWEWGSYLGEDSLEEGVEVVTSSWRRIGKNTIPPAAKACGQYVNSSHAKVEALRAGAAEAIMLNEEGFVSEGTGENLFIVRDGAVLTPPLTDGPLGGITRDSAIRIARDEGFDVHETSLVRTDLYLADEAFFTGTAAEVVPIRSVDGREIGDRGPITTRIQDTFVEAVRGKVGTYDGWLTYVHG